MEFNLTSLLECTIAYLAILAAYIGSVKLVLYMFP